MGRYHHLDALRGAAMLVGILWHLGLSYTHTAPASPTGTRVGDWSLFGFLITSNSVRMPLFMLIAGFFAAMLRERADWRAFWRGRLKRIGVPFLVGMVTVVPLVHLATALRLQRDGLVERPIAVDDVFGLAPLHLWFLWYLLLFYAGAMLMERTAGRTRRIGDALVTRLIESPLRLVPLIAVGAVLLRLRGDVSPNAGLVPTMGALWLALFFALGWVLWRRREHLDALARAPLAHGALGLAAAVTLTAVRRTDLGLTVGAARPWVVAVLTATACWGLLFALTGAATRFFDRDRPAVRYVVDASFWMYLTHQPLVALGRYLTMPLGLPFLVDFLILAVVVGGLTFGSYALLVRHSAAGRLLHGERTRGRTEQVALA